MRFCGQINYKRRCVTLYQVDKHTASFVFCTCVDAVELDRCEVTYRMFRCKERREHLQARRQDGGCQQSWFVNALTCLFTAGFAKLEQLRVRQLHQNMYTHINIICEKFCSFLCRSYRIVSTLKQFVFDRLFTVWLLFAACWHTRWFVRIPCE